MLFLNIKYQNKKIKPHNYVKKKKKKKQRINTTTHFHTDPIYYSTLNLTFTSQLSFHIRTQLFTNSQHQRKEKRERGIWSAGGDRCIDRRPVEIGAQIEVRWRSWCTDRRPVEIGAQIEGRWGSWCTDRRPVEIGVYHEALPRPPPHRHSSSSLPPDWIRSAYSFFFFFFSFFHICLFWFNFIIRIWFCFVFCVWIMWDVFWEWSKETETKTKCSLGQIRCSLGQIRCFLISFYFYSNSLLVDIFFPTKNSKYSGMVPFKTLNFLFLKRDIWEL